MDTGLSGIAKILPFPKDNPLSYSVEYEGKTYKNSIIYKGKLHYGTNEYLFNETSLTDISRRILKKDQTYQDTITDKLEQLRDEYYDKKKSRDMNTNFTNDEKQKYEEYSKQIESLYEKIESIGEMPEKEKELNILKEKIDTLNFKIGELFQPEYFRYKNKQYV